MKIRTGSARPVGRQQFLNPAALTFAASQFGLPEFANAESSTPIPSPLAASISWNPTAFASLKQTQAGVLNVGYADDGPPDGPAVILLHGRPYDIHSFVDVSPLLVSAGYRVVVPYLRGYGTTRFTPAQTFRNGQQSAVGFDILALMDALRIQRKAGGPGWSSVSH